MPVIRKWYASFVKETNSMAGRGNGFTKMVETISFAARLATTPTSFEIDKLYSPASAGCALEMLNVQRDKDVLMRLVELAASTIDWSWRMGGEDLRCRLVNGCVRCGRASRPPPGAPIT